MDYTNNNNNNRIVNNVVPIFTMATTTYTWSNLLACMLQTELSACCHDNHTTRGLQSYAVRVASDVVCVYVCVCVRVWQTGQLAGWDIWCLVFVWGDTFQCMKRHNTNTMGVLQWSSQKHTTYTEGEYSTPLSTPRGCILTPYSTKLV